MHKKFPPHERKAQIIQIALQLFAVKGYNDTTVNDIIDKAKISKGGFYYHYNSKKDLVEDIVWMLIGDMKTIIEQIDKRDDLTALEKANEYIKSITVYKTDKIVETVALLSELYSGDKNIQLEKKFYDFARKHLAPVKKKIILQGIEEGTFKTEFPEEAAETYVKLFIMQQQEITDLFYKCLVQKDKKIMEIIKRKYMFFQNLLEDTLGLDKGSLVAVEAMAATAERMCKKIMGSKDFGPNKNGNL